MNATREDAHDVHVLALRLGESGERRGEHGDDFDREQQAGRLGHGRPPAGCSSTTSAPPPPSAGRAWQNAMTSSRCASHTRVLPRSTGCLSFEPSPLPWITRTQRRPRFTASRRNSAEQLARFVGAASVQVDLVLDHPVAAAQLAQHIGTDAAAGGTTVRRPCAAACRSRTRPRPTRRAPARRPRGASSAAEGGAGGRARRACGSSAA